MFCVTRYFGYLAPPKLLPSLRPCLHRADQQRVAAFWALPLGCWVATPLEVLQMLALGGEARRAAVDLRGAVWRIQRYFVRASVGLLIQLPMGEQAHQQFTDLPLGPGRFEQADQQGCWDEPGQHAPDLGDYRAVIHFLP